jgi:exodeoxyribonuclease VII large subunit
MTAPPTPVAGPVTADYPEQPALGVAELQQRIGDAVAAAFPNRLWVCGEIIAPPAVRGGGSGLAFSLAERQGTTVVTLKAWLGRPYYPQLRQHLGDAAITALLAVGNVVVVGGRLEFGGPFGSLELKVDRVVLTPAGPGQVSLELESLRGELAASGLLGQQRATIDLPLAPLRVGIVTGGAGTVGYQDTARVLAESGFRVRAVHYPAPLEGAAAPARLAAQIAAAASTGNQAVLVVRGGGEAGQLAAFNAAEVAAAIANAPVPVFTGIGHSRDSTLADDAAWRACASPTAAATAIAERLHHTSRALDEQLAKIGRMAEARRKALAVAVWRRLALAAAAAALTALAAWRGGAVVAALAVLVGLAALAIRRRRRVAAPALRPRPAAASIEAVVQELGAVEAALRSAATSADVEALLQAAGWLHGRGGELLGRAPTSG